MYVSRSRLALFSALLALTIVCSACVPSAYRTPYPFTSQRDETLEQSPPQRIGVVVLSDGPMATLEDWSRRFSVGYYASPIDSRTVLYPDTSTTGPSYELAQAIIKRLERLGYAADEFSDLGHTGPRRADVTVELAQQKGFDAVMIVSYRGFAHAQDEESAFLYVPQVTLFRASDQRVLWTFFYYGSPRPEDLPTDAPEAPIRFLIKSLGNCAGETYLTAAQRAADEIFDPSVLKQHYLPLPRRSPLERF